MLNMANLCYELQVLPRAGGLLDQDSFFVHVMFEFSMAMGERKRKDAEDQRRAMHRAGR